MGNKTWADLAGEMKTFLWNPEERTCMGRTAKSWGRSLFEPHFQQPLHFLLHSGCTFLGMSFLALTTAPFEMLGLHI